MVGGTGLYLQAALTDLELRPPPDDGIRRRLEADLAARGAAALHAELAARDARAAGAIEPGDRTRVLRALELLEMGEDPAPSGERSELWTARLRHPTVLCGLVMDREALYERIDERVEAMVAAGAAEEVRRADAAGASRTARAGARLRGAAGRRRGGDEAAHAQLREAPAHVDAAARRPCTRST